MNKAKFDQEVFSLLVDESRQLRSELPEKPTNYEEGYQDGVDKAVEIFQLAIIRCGTVDGYKFIDRDTVIEQCKEEGMRIWVNIPMLYMVGYTEGYSYFLKEFFNNLEECDDG